MEDRIIARVWPETPEGRSPAEQKALGENKQAFGVCISGGGSRSLSAAMGQLRGLRELGHLSKVAYLSCVSGGCWASTLYTYLPVTIADETFLGPVIAPDDLTWDGLAEMDAHALGSVPQRLGWEALAERAVSFREEGIPEEHLWARAIGELVLAPFGLGDHPARYFTWDERWLLEEILPSNPTLTQADFVLARPDRPFLITNATLFYPPDATHGPFPPDALASPYRIESTPLGVGVSTDFPGAGSTVPGQSHPADIGGGWTDPFSFGGDAPTAPPLDGRFDIVAPTARYRLSDAAGASSSAFVGTIIEKFGSRYPWMEKLVPVFPYWPVHDAGEPRNGAIPHFLGDGGNFEDTGIVGLLRRDVQRIVCFVNGETPLSWDPVVKQPGCDSQLADLFGYAPKEAGLPWRQWDSSDTAPQRLASVFEADEFLPLLDRLWDASSKGHTALNACHGLKVAPNPRLGLRGGQNVDVLFVVNTPVRAWFDALPWEVRDAMRLEFLEYGSFPNYATLLQLHLTERQVNLLAHLSCWNVVDDRRHGDAPSNAEVFNQFFDG